MLAVERQNKILAIVQKQECVTVKMLCSHIFASEATIRRDIREMAAKNVIKKVHGGITVHSGSNQDIPALIRFNTNIEKKKHIASIALRYIVDSNTLFLDASSTCAYLASLLHRFSHISIVTNGLHSMNILNKTPDITVFVCGGVITGQSALVGEMAVETVERFRADVLFMSCGGLSLAAGITEAAQAQAAVKRSMIKNARKRILLCDSDKMQSEYFCKICGFDEIDAVITDSRPPEPIMEKIGSRCVYE